LKLKDTDVERFRDWRQLFWPIVLPHG